MKAHFHKKEAIAPEKQTAQDFINVQGVEGRILYTKDKKLFTYALIKSNDTSLMTDREQSFFIESVCRALATERKPFKLILLPRSIDISAMLNMLMELKNSTSDPTRLELIRKEMDYTSTFPEREQDIKETACYLVMWENQSKNGKLDLLKRMDTVLKELHKSSVVVVPLEQAGIAFMCNLFANPQYAHGCEDEELKFSMPHLGEEDGNEAAS